MSTVPYRLDCCNELSFFNLNLIAAITTKETSLVKVV